jgi:hypothetical protein
MTFDPISLEDQKLLLYQQIIDLSYDPEIKNLPYTQTLVT